MSLAVIGTLTGLAVGGAQRLALRPYGTALRSWIVHCGAAFGSGLSGGGLAADVLLGGLHSVAGFATLLGVAGLIVGLLTMRSAERLAVGLPVQGAV